jgi:hypothetical protein
MGKLTAAVLPVTVVIVILIAVTRPIGSDSFLLAAGVLALAGIALLGRRLRQRPLASTLTFHSPVAYLSHARLEP